MLFRSSFVTLALVLAAVGTPVKRDAATVQSDLKTIITKSTALDNAINAFPNSGGTLSEAIAIYADANDLANFIRNATTDVTNSAPFTNDEAESLLQSVQTVVSIVQNGSNDLVEKEAAVTAVGAKGYAEQAIDTIEINVKSFGAQFIPKFPAGDQATVQDAINEIVNELDAARQAYKAA